MINNFWRYVTIDEDEEVTLYKEAPQHFIEGKAHHVGERLTVALANQFPQKGKLRLTSNNRDTVKIVLKRTPVGDFFIKWGGIRYGSYKKAPCVFTLPQSIVARDRFLSDNFDRWGDYERS